jgi:A/G-specific adenine glycosylase
MLSFADRLVAWQALHGRHDLPWQASREPYRVWLSEVMLQQTQVVTVKAYFTRFIERFPDVASLAAASQDEVLSLWSGLGYYSRARNLHACAQAVVQHHGGGFPQTASELQALPGIGPSTAAAIAAFCFGEPVSIFDGNVQRVMARHLGFEGDLAQAPQSKALQAMAQGRLPARNADLPAYTQGLMDLGATVCTPRAPQCARCPVAADCEALAQQRVDTLPVKSRKLKRSRRHSHLLVLQCGQRVWLTRRPEQGVWGGLWAFPVLDDHDDAALSALLQGAVRITPLPAPIRHALTHFDWVLQPVRARLARPRKLDDHGQWLTLPAALALGLPKPVRHLLQALVDERDEA